MTGDQRDFVLLMAACIAIPAIISWLLAKFKSSWTPRKRVLVSALPLPALIWLLCTFVFLDAAFASEAECGVDACGMAMAFSIIIAGAALIGLFVGMLAAGVVVSVMRWSSS